MKQWLETRQILEHIAELKREGRPAALATVVRVRGSAYRHEGAKLVVSEDGRSVGNVSGGCLEADVREVARRVISSGAPELRTYCGGSSEIAAWDLGVGCDGEVEILIEPVLSDRAHERELIASESTFVAITRLDPALAASAHAPRAVKPLAGEPHREVLAGEAAAGWLALGSSQIVKRDGVHL
jgi:xanthine/CO dehydrogenase XdhC/CoxF family maturation factor